MKASPARKLLAWYDRHRRELPWRAKRGERADPYRVWLSEIMLQQTTVQAVGPYFKKFLARWPDVRRLAAAPLDDVLAAWAGLGYYARARNLHRAAKFVTEEFGGRFPQTAEALRKLPGIGVYTSGAIASIAFDEREAAVDANAERVIARLFAVDEPLPLAKTKLRTLTQSLVPEKRAGDFAQALMDLGATICTPKRPACGNCPWNVECEARKRGIQEALPVKAVKVARPLRRGAAFVARDAKGAVLLMKRPEKGLLGGMLQPPLGPWTENFPTKREALSQAPFPAEWKKLNGIVHHGFTHFELEIEVYAAEITARPKQIKDCHSRPSDAQHREGKGTHVSTPRSRSTSGSPSLDPLTRASPGMTELLWVENAGLSEVALPTIMRKIISHALEDSGPLFRSAHRRA
jgi:A/G-specific adenine glycosylase